MRAGRQKKNVAQAELDQRWDRFAHLPGTRLSWHKRRWGNWDLVTANGEVWATVKEGWGSTQISARGKTYYSRDVSEPYKPPKEWEWVDDAGLPVLRFKGTHFERRAYTTLTHNARFASWRCAASPSNLASGNGSHCSLCFSPCIAPPCRASKRRQRAGRQRRQTGPQLAGKAPTHSEGYALTAAGRLY